MEADRISSDGERVSFWCRKSLISMFVSGFWVLALFDAQVCVALAQPVASISYPEDGMLIRANVPVFGLAYVKDGAFRRWYLEYGEGRNPKAWVRLKESETAQASDPYLEGRVVWNVNKEPTGNITNWAVGLASYSYAGWGRNYNGIYTLRLVTEAEDGAVAEARKVFFVGEAILRLYGGAAVSADLACRVVVPPFAFEGDLSRVVAIIKQVPPEGFAGFEEDPGVNEGASATKAIYESTLSEFTLKDFIYRIYPNGLRSEPSLAIEIRRDGDRGGGEDEGFQIYQWRSSLQQWEPLTTRWFGETARADVSELAEGETYVALMKRKNPPSMSTLSWVRHTSLSGVWRGQFTPHAKGHIVSKQGRSVVFNANADGVIEVPYILDPGFSTYLITLTPLEGEGFSLAQTHSETSGTVLSSIHAVLSTEDTTAILGNGGLRIHCKDASLADSAARESRSLLLNGLIGKKAFKMEVAESIPGSGDFSGKLVLNPDKAERHPESFRTPVTHLPVLPAHGSIVSLSAGTATINIPVMDITPPRIGLTSATHPALLYATPSGDESLSPGSLHSFSHLSVVDDAWKIGGAPGERNSARVVAWPQRDVSIQTWPLIGFSYKLYQPAPWQLILRSRNKVSAFTMGEERAWFKSYAASIPLIADGEWHYWQRNLTGGAFKEIDGIAFGSWMHGGYLLPVAGFSGERKGNLFIRSLWIGSAYKTRAVQMEWKITDASPITDATWWVDESPESSSPGQAVLKGNLPSVPESGKIDFTVPEDGRWFFHMKVKDSAGNTSPVASFPLLIQSETPGATALKATIDSGGVIEREWDLLDGSFEVFLPGLGPTLDPASLSLQIGDTLYPLAQPDWNVATEKLTIARSHFDAIIPLGFNGEELIASLIARDLDGRRLPLLPRLKLYIRSPFEWKAAVDGGHLAVNDSEKRQWFASWRNQPPPWLDAFPGSINNTLSLSHQAPVGMPIQRFIRPIRLSGESAEPLYWEEEWQTPKTKKVPLRETIDRHAFGANPAVDPIPERIPPVNPDRRSWIYVQTALDPFEPAVLRVTTGGSSLPPERSERLDPRAILSLIERQTNQIIRLNGWLPPGEGHIRLFVPGERELRYAIGEAHTFTKGKGIIELTAGSEWTRFTIQIAPPKGHKPINRAALHGVFYH